MKRILCFTVLLMFYFHSSGQTLTGRVVSDIDNQTIEGAVVQIVDADESTSNHGTTDSQGLFKLDASLSSFSCRISCTGFRDVLLSIDNPELKSRDLGDVIMYADSSTRLKEIVVAANHIDDRTEKMIVYPTTRQLEMSSSGLELLNNLRLPGLSVRLVEQEVKISTGASDIIYRINGMNSSLKEVLTLKADQVQRVEYSPLGTIREMDTNSAVLNFIVKIRDTGTYFYGNALGAFSTGFINGNANLKQVWRDSEISVDYNVSWRDYDERWSEGTKSYIWESDTTTYHEIGRPAPFGYLTQDINIAYTLNKGKNIFRAEMLNTIHRQFDQNYIDTYMRDMGLHLFFRNIYSRYKNYIPELDLYYIHNFEEGKVLEVNVVGTIIDSDYKRELTDTYSTHDYNVFNKTDGKRKSLAFESLYSNDKSALRYSFGLKGAYSRLENKYGSGEKYTLDRKELYPYASLDGNFGKLSYSLGTGLKILSQDDKTTSKEYYKNLSSLSLFFKSSEKWNIRNVFRYSPGYPSLGDLADRDERQDSLMVMRGSSRLTPSQTLSERMTINYYPKNTVQFTANLYFTKTFDKIGAIYYYDPSIVSFVTESSNLDYWSNIGASIDTYISSIFNIFDIAGTVGWNHYKTKGPDFTHKLSNMYWEAALITKIKSFSCSIYYAERSKNLGSQTVSVDGRYSNVSVNYSKKNLRLTAGMSYLIAAGAQYEFYRKAAIVPSSNKIYIKDNDYMVTLGVSYYISRGKSAKRVDTNLVNGDRDSGVNRISD